MREQATKKAAPGCDPPELAHMPDLYDKRPLLVAVGTPNEPRSLVWRLWVQNDDVYFLAQLSHIKVSLHKSGDWRIAHNRPPGTSKTNRSRLIQKWERPLTPASGLVNCVAVYVPPILPQFPFPTKPIHIDGITWVPPSYHLAIMLFVTIAAKGRDIDSSMFTPNRLVGRRRKANGETVLLVAHEREFADPFKKEVTWLY